MEYPIITWTCTTFKRFDLFTKTIDSFLDTCKDLDLIYRWIVSDDGSNEQDLIDMNNMYPFLEIYNGPQRGQAANVNYLFDKVKTEWFFHCEDDWLFLKKDNYIRKLFDIAFDDDKIKNVVLRPWKLYEVESTKIPGLKYNLHEYDPDNSSIEKHLESDCNWFGYSLNPGIQHKPTIDLIGKHPEKSIGRLWDRTFASKYLIAGFKRANPIEDYIKHIGVGANSTYVKN